MVNFKVLSSFLGCPKEDDLDRAKFPGCLTEDFCFFGLKSYFFYKWRYFSGGDELIWFLRIIQHHHVVIKSRNNWRPWINTDIYIYICISKIPPWSMKRIVDELNLFFELLRIPSPAGFLHNMSIFIVRSNCLDSWWCPSQALLHPVYVGKCILHAYI